MQADEPARLHSPPPSAAAPRPRGILKNASSQGAVPLAEGYGDAADDAGAATTPGAEPAAAPAGADDMNVDAAARAAHLQWDETNLTLHEIERENAAARMKIDEPKTPFVRGSSLGPDDMGEDNFALDTGSASSASGSRTSSRRPSAAELTKANTAANARLGGGSGAPVPALGRDDADMALDAGEGGLGISGSGSAVQDDEDAEMATATAGAAPVSPGGSQSGQSSRSGASGGLGERRRRSDYSRSPSFNLPDGTVLLQGGGRRRSSARSSSAGADSSRNGVRAEALNGHAGANGGPLDDDADDEEDEDLDPETREKHEAFAAKRKGHYGNEAEALKAAKLLAQQDDEEEDDDDEEGGLPPPPVPHIPAGLNGSR